MSATNKYLHVRDEGSSPKQIYLALKADGVGQIESIRILRELFQLSLLEAKEIIVTTDESVNSLAEYQESIFPLVIQAIEITDSEDGKSGRSDRENT